MNDQLSQALSDALNNVNSGVGDISSWLTTSALPSLCSAKAFDSLVWTIACAVVGVVSLLVAIFCVIKYEKVDRYNKEFYAMLIILSLFFAGLAAIFGAWGFRNYYMWSHFPDVQLLEYIANKIKSLS